MHTHTCTHSYTHIHAHIHVLTDEKDREYWSVPSPTNLLCFGLEMSVAAQRHLNWKTDLSTIAVSIVSYLHINTDHSETMGFNVKQKLPWLSFVTGCNEGGD